MKLKLISVILILITLTACLVARMPEPGDSTKRAMPTPTLGFLYIEETVIEPGFSIYPERASTWTPPAPEYLDPYPAPGLPVPYP